MYADGNSDSIVSVSFSMAKIIFKAKIYKLRSPYLNQSWITKSETPITRVLTYPKLRLWCVVGLFNLSLDHFGFFIPRLFHKLTQGPSHKIFRNIFENWQFWKPQFFGVSHFDFFFFFQKKIAWFPWKSVKNYVIEWIGLSFDVFPGFQQIQFGKCWRTF